MKHDLAMVENDRLSSPSLRGHESCFINKAQFPFCRVIFPTKPFCILFCFNSMAASEVISCVFAVHKQHCTWLSVSFCTFCEANFSGADLRWTLSAFHETLR